MADLFQSEVTKRLFALLLDVTKFVSFLDPGLSKSGVSNLVSYAGHILTKKGSRAALREKMSPRAAIGG